MATPTLVDHVASSSNFSGTPGYPLGGASASSTTFLLNKPNASLASNCLILTVSCPYSAGRTITITDNKSNSWPAVPTAKVNNGTSMLSIFVLVNATTGTQSLTIVFDAALNNVSFQLSEFYNIATSSPVDGGTGVGYQTATTSATATIATGSMTTLTAGDLIYQVGISVATPTVGSATITNISAGSSFTIINAGIYLGSFCQYLVQSSAGAINPSATLTGSTEAFNTIAIALKNASAGNAPAAGIHVDRVYHCWASRNSPVIFPCAGNLLFMGVAAWYDNTYAPQWQITGITSSPSNTWVETTQLYAAKQMPQCWYAANASTSSSMAITVGGLTNTYGMSFVFYDVSGADTSPVSRINNAYWGNFPGSTTRDQELMLYSPGYNNELVFIVSAVAFGSITKLSVASSPLITFDTVTYNGVGTNDLMDNVDLYGHAYITSGSLAIGVNDHNASGSTDFFNSVAIGFRSSGATAIGTPNIVQNTFGKTLSSPHASAVFANNTTTGNTLVVVAGCYDGATVRTVSSIAVSSGAATFAKIISQVGIASTYGCNEGWAAPNITGGTTPTVTVTFSGAITSAVVFIYELSNMPTTVTTDGTAAGKAGASSTALTAPAITTVSSNDIIFTNFAVVNNSIGENGWFQMVDTSGGSTCQCEVVTSSQIALVATGTETPTGAYSAIVFALKGLAAPTNYNFSGTGSISVSGAPIPVDIGVSLSGPIAVTGAPPVFSLGPKLAGSLILTGASNLPASQPQLTGLIALSGAQSPAIGPRMTASISESGTIAQALAPTSLTGTISGTALIVPSLALPPLTGSIVHLGSAALSLGIAEQLSALVGLSGAAFAPAIGPQMTGSIIASGSIGGLSVAPQMSGAMVATGILFPGVSVQLTGSIFVSGSTSLGGLVLTGLWGVSGQLLASLGLPSLTGAILGTGLISPSLGPQLSGSIAASGVYNPTVAPQLAGIFVVTGASSLGSLQLLGFVGLTGQLLTSLLLPPLTGSIGHVGALAPAVGLSQLLAGSIGLNGSTSPAIGLSNAGSLAFSGTTSPAIGAQLAGAILATGLVSPSVALTLIGSIVGTGVQNPGLSVPLTGTIVIVGVTNLSALALTGSWGLTGILSPAIMLPPLSGSVIHVGSAALSIGLSDSLLGSISSSGLIVPGLSTVLTGQLSAFGALSPSIALPQLTGSITQTGLYLPSIGPQLQGIIAGSGLIAHSITIVLVGFIDASGSLVITQLGPAGMQPPPTASVVFMAVGGSVAFGTPTGTIIDL